MRSEGTVTVADETMLLDRIRAGDERALEALYDIYGGPLYGFALRRLGERALADEVVQQVMTRVWQNAASYDGSRGSVRSWIYAIARNAAIDARRHRTRQETVNVVSDVAAAEDEFEQLVQAELIRSALEQLSAAHREVLDLAYFSGLSQAEVADRLRLPLGTVKSRTYYALKALRLACDELGVHE